MKFFSKILLLLLLSNFIYSQNYFFSSIKRSSEYSLKSNNVFLNHYPNSLRFNPKFHQVLRTPQNSFLVSSKLHSDFSTFDYHAKETIYLPTFKNYSFAHKTSNINFIPNPQLNYFSNYYFKQQVRLNSLNVNSKIQLLDLNSEYGQQFMSSAVTMLEVGTGMVGFLLLMPKSVTKWEDDFVGDAMSNLNRAFSEPPVIDKDHWEINYIGHPYAGAIYYNAFRSKNSTVMQAFMFSLFASTTWEYVLEGVAEQPSIQDLIVTPVVGSILGEVIHVTTLDMRKNGFNLFEKIFVTIFNPMYVINNGYN